MNRNTFRRAMERRGYTVTNIGLITFLDADMEDGGHYTATWFFNADGTRDTTKSATVQTNRPKKSKRA